MIKVKRKNGTIEEANVISFDPLSRIVDVTFKKSFKDFFKESESARFTLLDILNYNKGGEFFTQLINIPKPKLLKLNDGSDVFIVGLADGEYEYAFWNKALVENLNNKVTDTSFFRSKFPEIDEK